LFQFRKPLDEKTKELQGEEQSRSILESKVGDMKNNLDKMKAEFDLLTSRLDEVENSEALLAEKEEKLKGVQKTNDDQLAERTRMLKKLEMDLAEMNALEAKNEQKLKDKQEDINNLEKVLKLDRIRSLTKQDENEEKDEQIRELEKSLEEAGERLRKSDDFIRYLKQEVEEARDEEDILEENHSVLIRAKDELRTDTLSNRYY